MFAPRGRSQLRLLLDVADLDALVPSTLWDRSAEGTWRTGLGGGAGGAGGHRAQPAWQAAAHEAGSVTAWRSFTSEEGDVVTLQVVPLASGSDAADALAAASAAATDPAVGFRTAPLPATATATAPATAPAGEPVTLAGTVGATLVVARAAGPGWTGHDLADVLAAQLAKLPAPGAALS